MDLFVHVARVDLIQDMHVEFLYSYMYAHVAHVRLNLQI